MDRNDEYLRLLDEISAPCEGAAGTVERARVRLRRRRMVTRPVGMLAVVFVCFVALVNFCAPVAEACSGVPGLRELARAVTFSRSLSDAVDNEYVQPIELVQSDGDVTATVEYLIVDQKQVTVFFRLDSEVYEYLTVDPGFRNAESGRLESCAYHSNDFDVPIGQLQSVTVDFVSGDVPDTMRMFLKVRDVGSWYASEPAAPAPADIWDDPQDRAEPEYVAQFDFLLEFDPWFTQQGKYIEVNQVMELDGQKIMIRDMEIYPSHLRLNVEDLEENSAWLRGLEFYIEADGEVFGTVKNGISATGVLDMMTSYRADSTFFYDAKELKVVVTAATWLSKDMERIHVDLANGVADAMPEGAELIRAEHDGKRWVVTVGCQMRGRDGDGSSHNFHQVFMGTCYDAEGNVYYINSWSSGLSTDGYEEKPWYFYEEFPLPDYPYDEVWLTPHYSSYWVAEEPVSITINVKKEAP